MYVTTVAIWRGSLQASESIVFYLLWPPLSAVGLAAWPTKTAESRPVGGCSRKKLSKTNERTLIEVMKTYKPHTLTIKFILAITDLKLGNRHLMHEETK